MSCLFDEHLEGRVWNIANIDSFITGIADANVLLKGINISATTDANGFFTLNDVSGIDPFKNIQSIKQPHLWFSGRKIIVDDLTAKNGFEITLLNIAGRTVYREKVLPNARYSLEPFANGIQITQGCYVLSLRSKGDSYPYLLTYVGQSVFLKAKTKPLPSSVESSAKLGKQLAISDTIIISKPGWNTRKIVIDTLVKTGISVHMVREPMDDHFLTLIQKKAFDYFYYGAHPVSGLAYDRYPFGGDCVSGGTGMGIMAIIVGIERGFISREDGASRINLILQSLTNICKRYHGAFSHFMNGVTGADNNSGDIVETSFVAEGLLTAIQYFKNNNPAEDSIRTIANQLWLDIDWNYYRKNNILHWTDSYDLPILGFDECMITYLLAIASPSHPISISCYKEGWAGGNYKTDSTFYGIKQYIQKQLGWGIGLSLFWTHYSYLGLDPRTINDGNIPAGMTYFDVFNNISRIDQAHCIKNPGNYAGYSRLVWGLTAGDEPPVFGHEGYFAHDPGWNDNGTINPTAAISAIPYMGLESSNTMKHLYENYPSLWGEYGFYDGFNLDLNWYSNSYIAIDQGPIVIMIENYRTQLLWKLFMSHPDIKVLIDTLKANEWTITRQGYSDTVLTGIWNYQWPMDTNQDLASWDNDNTGSDLGIDAAHVIQGAASFSLGIPSNGNEAKLRTLLEGENLINWQNAEQALVNLYVPDDCNAETVLLYVWENEIGHFHCVERKLTKRWNKLVFNLTPEMKNVGNNTYMGLSIFGSSNAVKINKSINVDGIFLF